MCKDKESETSETAYIMTQILEIDAKNDRYPYCIVWTPIPFLTWFFPFIGHMGICTSSGVIRDFAGSYYVSEDNMGFGRPTKYWQLDSSSVQGGATAWDRAVADAADVYKTRVHNLCCDNCHSMVALALNDMRYDGKTSWNMVNVAFLTLVYGRYVSFSAWLKTWLPFLLFAVLLTLIIALQKAVL